MEYKLDTGTSTDNDKNMEVVSKFWNLGPTKTSIQPTDNKDYWKKMADIWNCSEREARTRLCANCEYYNNTPSMQEQMLTIPLNKFDLDGGGRGYCHAFKFICHNLRTCQAWEEKEFELED